MNVQQAPVSVHSAVTDSSSLETQVEISWDAVVLELVDEVDIVVFGYRESDGVIDFSLVKTLADGVDYHLGNISVSDIDMINQLDFDVGVIGVISSGTQEDLK